MLLKHVRHALYEVVIAALESSRSIHAREMRRRDANDPSREPDGILYWARQSELLEQTSLRLRDRWKLA